MAANANKNLMSHNLNKNTEAVARAIWAQVDNKYVKQPGNKNGLNKLKIVRNRVIRGGWYPPPKPGFLSGLTGMFSSKPAANKNGNIFYETSTAKPRRFDFFRRFGRTKTPLSPAVTKTAVQQANTIVSVWNKLTSETSNTAQQANASLLAANNAANQAREAAKEIAKQQGVTTEQKVAANAKAYKAEKVAKLARDQRNQAAKSAAEAAARLKEAQSNKNKTVEAAQKASEETLAQYANQGEINAQKAVALAKANEGIKASVMNTNKKILQFIKNDWWPTTNGKFQNKNKKVWKARQNNKKNALRKNLEAKLKKINSSLTFNNVTAARVNKALENKQIGWKRLLRRYNNNKQQRRNWGLNLIRSKNLEVPTAGNQTIRNQLFNKGQSFNFWGMHGPSLNGPLKNILTRTKNKTKRFQLGFGPKTITPSNAQYQALKTKNAKGRYYGNLKFWENPGLPAQIEISNLPELQKNALRRMIRSVKLNKKYPGKTRNASNNRMELTNNLMKIENNAALKNALVKKISEQAAANAAARRPSGVRNKIPNTPAIIETPKQLNTYNNHLRNSGNY